MKFEANPFAPVSRDTWRETVERDLRGADFDRRLVKRTDAGIPVQPLYTRHGAPAPGGAPGEAPFTRGVSATGGWQIRQEYTEGDARTANAAILADIAQGVDAIHIRLDRAFRLGAAASAADVGVDGVCVVDRADMIALLDGVDLSTVPVTIDAGANTVTAFAFLADIARMQRAEPHQVQATITGDPLDALLRDGALPGSLDDAWDGIACAFAFAKSAATQLRPWVVSTRTAHRAGADATLELALGLASAVEGLRALEARGIAPDAAATRLEWHTEIGRDVFMDAARLRATRTLWHAVLDACGCGDVAAKLRIHAAGSQRTRTRRDPWVNMLRGTSETFAAVVGGATSIAATPFDAAIGDADVLSRRVARNTQLVLRDESHLDAVADPAGGSWYVESLTQALCDGAWAIFQEIEAAGGLAAGIADASVQARVEAAAEKAEAALRTRRKPVTGVSTFANPGETLPARSTADRSALCARRDDAIASGAQVAPIKRSPASTEAVLLAMDAVGERGTAAGISAALHGGTQTTAAALAPRREAEAFEALMDACDAATERGTPATIFLAAIGPVPKHKARAGWTTHFFHAGGIRVLEDGAADDVAGAVEAFAKSGARAAVVVAHDALYPDILDDAIAQLREAGAAWVAVAGKAPDPAPNEAPDAYVHVGVDVVETLTAAATALEVIR